MAQTQREQVPLAPFILSTRVSSQEDQAVSEQKVIRIRKYIKCCGCVTALLLVLIVIFLVLGFTVFNIKDPEMRMNGVTVLNGTLLNDTTYNITLFADVSMKNPNAFTFRFGNTTTTVSYDGTGIGEGRTAPGKARARRTLRLNVTVEIMSKKLLGSPSLTSDLSDQAFNISSYTRIDGKVKILNLFKRKVVVEMNCTIEYNITTGSTTHGDNCLTRVEI